MVGRQGDRIVEHDAAIDDLYREVDVRRRLKGDSGASRLRPTTTVTPHRPPGPVSDRGYWAVPIATAATHLRPLITAVIQTAKGLDVARLECQQALQYSNDSFIAIAD